MMKKGITFLLAITMLLSLSACGDKTPSDNKDHSGSNTPDVSENGGTQTQTFENKIALSIDKAKYDKEERIEVTMDFSDVDKDNAVIVIVKSDMAHDKLTPAEENTEEYRWLADFSEIPFYLWAPDTDGIFDVRVYTSSNGEELAFVSFAVGNATLPQKTDTPSTSQNDKQTTSEDWPSISYLKDADRYTGDGTITQIKEWDASGESKMWTIYYDNATFESVENYVADLVKAGWMNHYADEDGNYMEKATDKGIARAYYCTCDYAEVEIQVADYSNSMNFTDKPAFSFNLSIEFSKV